MPRASGAIVFAVAISPGTSAQVVEFMMVVVSVLVRCTLSPTITRTKYQSNLAAP